MEDDVVTIDHLIGVRCILNSSVEVEVGRNLKDSRLELQTQDGARYFFVNEVVDVLADGGFRLRIASSAGREHEGVLIAKKLFEQ